MSIFYHVVIDSNGKWIKSPNNGGECCTTQEDTVETLNKLIQERDALQARVTTLQVLWDQRWKMMRELEVVCGTEDVEKAVEYIKGLKARVKRLEEAGDRLDSHIACGCGVDGPCRSCVKALDGWKQAKEANP